MSGLTRRAFLQTGIAGTGSLLLGCRSLSDPDSRDPGVDDDARFDAWLSISDAGQVRLYLDRVEMGQGTTTAYATLIAEELGLRPDQIEVQSAPVAAAFQHPLQVTGGSTSLAEMWTPLRETGARARELLQGAAAERWGVPVDGLRVADGVVTNPETGETLGLGTLAAVAARRRASSIPVPRPSSEYRWIGRSFPRVDAPAKVNGQARYGIDVQVPGLRTAVVVHCPHFGGSLRSFDASEARRQPGVEGIFEVPGGVAVVASSTWRAQRAARKLQVEWDPGSGRGVDSDFIQHGLASALDRGELHENRNDGNTERALEQATRVVEAEYRLPYLAHATMEPMNCTIVPTPGGCDVYVSSQGPDVFQDVVAAVLDLDRTAVRVHTTTIGGGFGRRIYPDIAEEAAHIARQFGGPVKLVWLREDDMRRDFYRPPGLHRLRGAVDAQGKLDAWEHKLAAPSLLPYLKMSAGTLSPQWLRGATNWVADGFMSRLPGWIGPVIAVEGASNQPYATENVSVSSVAWDPGIPVGMWRSVSHSHNGFVVESFVDEMAHAAGTDPALFRRAHLADKPRHLAVLDRLVEEGNWGSPVEGHAQGIAVHEAFNTVVGQIAELSVDGTTIQVQRVTCVVDCGRAVNPDLVRAQMESGIIFGLTAALFGEITFEDGAAQQSNFHDQPLLTLAQAPEIAVFILERETPPSGVGEAGTPPIPAAVANAIFAATGERLRALPLRIGTGSRGSADG